MTEAATDPTPSPEATPNDPAPAPAEPTSLITDGAEPNAGGSLLGGDDTPAAGEGGDEPPEVETPEPITAETLTLPESIAADDPALGEFLGLMNNGELTPSERAQQLIDLQTSSSEAMLTALEQEQQSAWDSMQDDWKAQAKALPELGGENLGRTLSDIQTGLRSAGVEQEFFQALNLTGAGNHPAVIKALHILTKGFTEQPPVSGAPAGAAGKSLAERMFPNNPS